MDSGLGNSMLKGAKGQEKEDLLPKWLPRAAEMGQEEPRATTLPPVLGATMLCCLSQLLPLSLAPPLTRSTHLHCLWEPRSPLSTLPANKVVRKAPAQHLAHSRHTLTITHPALVVGLWESRPHSNPSTLDTLSARLTLSGLS